MGLLSLSSLKAYYGESQALFDVNLEVNEGEIVALMGRNGTGKSTTVKSIFQMIPTKGELLFSGKNLSKLKSFQISRLGAGLVPEGRRIFGQLSVKENLIAASREGRWNLEEINNLFPKLKERTGQVASSLSGGEQQMLAIARALMTNPRLLILDEATEGLAPIIKKEIWECLRQLKSREQSILIIDKNIFSVANLSDYNYIIEKGKNVWEGRSNLLLKSESIRERFLSL